jgi:serine/threonine protein kinase/formylglycine-generating enzyme required for sulfatase activity/Leucine-rich repeat (LRR) protein
MSEDVIFAAALDMSPAERAAYLDRTCGGNAVLRQRLERMLAAGDRAGNFMARPAVADSSESGTEILDANSTPNDVTVTRAGQDQVRAEDDEVPLGFLAPATRPDSLGRIGHYEVLQVLGQGGFGIVFRAFDEALHRIVAVKVLSPQMASTSPARKRFLREARSSAQVRHEYVVQVYAVEEQPLPYIAMEFIPGETLQQRLDRSGPLDVADVVRIGRQIAEGLAAAHATDLIHRDIKPGNILLEAGAGRVKITDFGLARAADDASISQSGLIAGTPMYMAPEQATAEALDQRADLFSLGSVLYVMAAGHPPFRANSTLAVLKRVAEDTPRSIREIIPETPQWLCDIIAKLHAKDPDERFQSAREVADVLADCEAQLKANAKLKDFSRIPQSKQPVAVKSGRWKWAAAAALLLPVLALAVTEFAGVTHLLREPRATGDAIEPGADSAPPQAADRGIPDSDGWVQLFNGKDLTGWKALPRDVWKWEVASPGELVGRGANSYLFSERADYEDFHFRIEAQINDNANGGQLFRVNPVLPQFPEPGKEYSVYGYEADIATFSNATTGSLIYPGKQDEPWVRIPAPPGLVRGGEWFRQEVIARGNHIVILVNGQKVVDHIGPRNTFRRGCLALQAYGPNAVVRFRKIEIKELPAGGAEVPLPPTYKNGIGMEFVIVPKSKSWLGGGKDKLGDKEVTLPADFYLGKYEVTQEEWTQVMGENPSHFSRTGGGKDVVKDIPDADLKRFPVEQVSWDQCQDFIKKLNEKEKEKGWVYRLPTEMEWEYACRGGPLSDKADSAFDFYFAKPSNSLLAEQANFNQGVTRTCKVGSYEANRLGLFDMHGNVWEWCEDAVTGVAGDTRRVRRGGGWISDYGSCRAALRDWHPPSVRVADLGLRLARVPAGAPSPGAKTALLDANVLKDAVLFMNFEKNTFYEKDGKTYVRDLSGRGNDGLCENVAFTADGKAGGGLLCEHGPVKATDSGAQDYAGGLRIGKSLITGQSNYTITAWCRKVSAGPANLYLICPTPGGAPDTRSSHFVMANYREGCIAVEVYNPRLMGEKWRRSSTDKETIPEKDWFFVAASLSDGEANGGKLRVFINDRRYSFNSQLAQSNPSDKDLVDLIGCNTSGAVIDELAVFQRALSDQEIMAIRALGMNGTALAGGKAPPAAVAPFTDADVQRIAALPAAEQVEEVRKELMRRNPGFDGKVEHKIEDGVVTELQMFTDNVKDIAPVRALPGLTSFHCLGRFQSEGKLSDLSALKGMSLTSLRLSYNPVRDLKPLAGMRLANFEAYVCPEVADLTPLRGMPITRLNVGLTRVQDLSPLKGMKLDWLNLYGTRVTSLEPLRGMPLKTLNIEGNDVTDLKALEGIELESINLTPKNITQGLELLRNLKTINSVGTSGDEYPAAEFWKRYDKGEFAVAPFTDADVQRIAALPAEQQVEEVRKELMRRNPGFDGKVGHKIEGDALTEFAVNTDQILDVAPVRALTGLVYLDLRGTYPNKGKLADLAPLKGMKLSRLDCSSTQIANLGPLTDVPLTILHVNHNPVADLTPIKGMKLESLGIAETKVTDLTPLKGMKLKILGAQLLPVTDLSPLEGMPLTGLDLYNTVGVTKLDALKGMPLEGLNLQNVPVKDLAPLKGMSTLRSLHLVATDVSDLSPLAGLKLTDLMLGGNQIIDLAPLIGLPLTRLHFYGTGVRDLRPLQGMSLDDLRLNPKNITQGLDVLREMKSLKTIGIDADKSWPATEFWERHDNGEFK